MIFAHGSDSSRHSPRNTYVAQVLRNRRFDTLLMDLLTSNEVFVDTRTAELSFDINLLVQGLDSATSWVKPTLPLVACQLATLVPAVV